MSAFARRFLRRRSDIHPREVPMHTTPAELTPHVPELLKYGQRLCGSEHNAQRLVFSTLDAAQKKRWKKTEELPMDAWLSLLMMQQFITLFPDRGSNPFR